MRFISSIETLLFSDYNFRKFTLGQSLITLRIDFNLQRGHGGIQLAKLNTEAQHK